MPRALLRAFLIVSGSAALMGEPVCAQEPAPPKSEDPLGAHVHTEDADRFAEMFARSNGKPNAETIQRDYLDPGTQAVAIFTPNRIQNAARLAKAIAADPAAYQVAIDRCLPVVKQSSAELQAIYLGLHGLYPNRPLPSVYALFGAGNSGGTAGDGAQVLGLEVLCAITKDDADLRNWLRLLFAHETVHTWQDQSEDAAPNPLLMAVLQEGAADYVASLVLGRDPSPERAAWALPRETDLWRQLQSDLAVFDSDATEEERQRASSRWVGNYQNAPDGWPYELGYWMGMRIWQRYVDQAADRRAAVETVLSWSDAQAILDAAGGPKG
ncbi:DUF2268 domain-containing putative Zn-dependent protease [Erythrobacter sp. LQ02-29]|uniref:DUF2268 domain-containing putative Zn-dependent protease n=1 Tax=Erythrobacter sp. LQ02-29 TaxID=2920384 RepID=UPI001F4D7BEE|nr:DUF2268 domain-containing putative Zn-dependent protease [Erythrobacter sp. LQ02-29]MCP9222465.1 DUF2268 domain-containing putative Zn-dependent protease [Erythrobacter sp. LQ02-29]